MQVIDIYGKDACVFCVSAKSLAKDLERTAGVRFFYNDVSVPVHRAALKKRMPVGVPLKSVPQIFVGATYVGGFLEFKALVASGHFAAAAGQS